MHNFATNLPHYIISCDRHGGGQFLSGGRHGNLETTKQTKTSSLGANSNLVFVLPLHLKTLGVKIDQFLTWDSHIDQISKKISSGISAMKKIKDFTNSDTLKSVYYGLVQPHFDYCCEVWNSINRGQSERLQKLHNRCARIIMNFKDEPGQSQMALDQLGWISLEERRKHIMARLMFKVVNNLAPSRDEDLINVPEF